MDYIRTLLGKVAVFDIEPRANSTTKLQQKAKLVSMRKVRNTSLMGRVW